MNNLNFLASSENRDFFHTYKRLGILIERGEGCYLYTSGGERILDMFGGLAVNVLGYNHPALIAAVESQIRKYFHLSNLFYQENQVKLAEKLIESSGMKKVFFSNSGTEAVEAAIKLSRKFFKGTEKQKMVSFTGSFHGRTMGALSLTARKKYKEDFAPLLPDVQNLAFNSTNELIENIDENTAIVFIECIQGEGGVNVASSEFVNELIVLRNKHEFLIAADEIQSGVGRTGKFSSFEHYGLIPDIAILAKGIGGGLPLGAMLGSERVENVFSYGDHGSTFGGNPVAAACGITVIDQLYAGVMENARNIGLYLMSAIENLKKRFHIIREVRGKGLMIGIELSIPCKEVVDLLIPEGVLINCTNENVIRLLPPLILTQSDCNFFLEKFEKVITKLS